MVFVTFAKETAENMENLDQKVSCQSDNNVLSIVPPFLSNIPKT